MTETRAEAVDPFRALFASCPDMLLVAGPDGAIVHSNEALIRALGPVRAGTRVAELVNPDDEAAFAAAWGALRAGEPRAEIACRPGNAGAPHACTLWRGAGREEIYGALRPAPERAGPPAEVGGHASEVTQQMILQAILYSLPLVVWAMDTTGRYLFSEGKALETVGLAPGLVVGKNVTDFNPTALDPDTALARAMKGESLHDVGNRVGRWWENWHIPLRDAQGNVTALAGVSLDVTDSKRDEQELLAKIALVDRQQQVIRELGTPIIEVWDGVLTLPMMGMIDTRRAAEMMDNLLDAVSRRQARYAILDLTGVGTVDSATASHLVALVRAVRLLGAEGVITGIRSSVAQTMVALGLDITEIVTLSNLREGIRHCIAQARKNGATGPLEESSAAGRKP